MWIACDRGGGATSLFGKSGIAIGVTGAGLLMLVCVDPGANGCDHRHCDGNSVPANHAAMLSRAQESSAPSGQRQSVLPKAYRDPLREHFGLGAVELLDELIYGPAGKDEIRRQLLELVQYGRSPGAQAEYVRSMAESIARMIEELNTNIRK